MIEDWLPPVIIVFLILFIILKFKRKNPKRQWLVFSREIDNGDGIIKRYFWGQNKYSGFKTLGYNSLGELKQKIGLK